MHLRSQDPSPPQLIGDSASIRELRTRISAASSSNRFTVISGESGAGKQLVAQLIHAESGGAADTLFTVHCNGSPHAVILHALEAFASALKRPSQRGTAVTLVLDGVPLRGSDAELRIGNALSLLNNGPASEGHGDIRIRVLLLLAPADQDSPEFRSALLQLPSGEPIHVPPLRDHPEDIPLLVSHFLRKFAPEMNKCVVAASKELLALLARYAWPGNVRELANTIERGLIACDGSELQPEHLALPTINQARTPLTLEAVERAHILQTLVELGGNKTTAAKALNIDRGTLYHKLKRLGLSSRLGS